MREIDLIMNPDFIKEAAHAFPDQIVLSVDVWNGKVAKDGWRSTSSFDPIPFVREFENIALAGIIVTDIDTHIGDAEDALALVSSIAAVAKAPVIASGIVRSLDDISRQKFVHNVSGAIIGRALFQKDVNLGEALAVANAVTGPTPDFI